MAIIFDTVLHDPIGRWFAYVGIGIGMVLVVIGIAAYVYLKYVKPKLAELNEKADVIRENVANDHPKNLREESDDRHAEVIGKVDLLVALVEGQGSSIKSLQNGQTSLYNLILGDQKDIAELQRAMEDTKTREQINQIIGDNHDGKHASAYSG